VYGRWSRERRVKKIDYQWRFHALVASAASTGGTFYEEGMYVVRRAILEYRVGW
jgi:hypothetical protein